MAYYPIPVVWDHPTTGDFEQFQAVLARHADQSILVHCAMNMRVSAFVYVHRRLCGVADEVAIADLHAIWYPNDTWQQFIHRMLENAGLTRTATRN